MKTKTLPVSVRLSAEDAAFLAEVHLPEATTPSEKIRALIREARQRRQGIRDYADGLRFQELQMGPVALALRRAETNAGKHSELLVHLAYWLPEIVAFFQAYTPTNGGEGADIGDLGESLDYLEAGVADRVVSLMEAVLRMGVTPHNPCYSADLIGNRLGIVLELCNLIASKKD
ncbi:MAG TPA: hypothetical protein VKN76_13710 [Kiloniellaceae bacterium]|nr:hypothetical protein [Kiloniellaceae bacterium]